MASSSRGVDYGHRYSGPWEIGVLAFLGCVLDASLGGFHHLQVWNRKNPGKIVEQFDVKTPGRNLSFVKRGPYLPTSKRNVTRVLNSAHGLHSAIKNVRGC